jgi:hypothetical protein
MIRLAKASTLVLCLIAPALTAAQQNAADLAMLRQQIEALSARVEALEEERGEVRTPFAVVDEAGAEILRVSVVDGQPHLELGREGATVFSAGIAADTRAAKLTVGSEQGARLEFALGDRGVGAALAIVDQAGVERINLEATGQASQIGIADQSAFEVFSVGVEGAEKPKLVLGSDPGTRIEAGIEGDDDTFLKFIDRGGAERALLSAEAEIVRIVLGEDSGARLQAGVTDDGGGSFLSLIDESNAERAFMMGSTEATVVALADATNEEVFSARLVEDQPRVVIGREGKSRLQAGVTTEGSGSFMSLIDTSDVERLHLTGDGEKTEMVIAGGDSEEQIALRLESRVPRLIMGKADGARLQAGVTEGGGGSFVSLIDIGNNERVAMTARGNAALLELVDPNLHATLGSVDQGGQKAGLYLGRDEQDLVALRLTETGGTVRVADPQGNVVAGLLVDAARGGRVVAAGAGGGTTLAALSGGPEGGQVSVFDKAGDVRAYLEAHASGDVAVLDDTGMILMTTGETAPRLALSDAAGTIMVRLGMSTDGVGVVNAGPAGNGVAATLGSQFEAASSIQGKK